MRHIHSVLLISGVCILSESANQSISKTDLSIDTKKEILGRMIFFDKNLSNPIGLSCADCHSPETGFSDPNHRIFSEGSVKNKFGNRNSPSISYVKFTPPFTFDSKDSAYTGGFFYDGRSSTLEQQAEEPLMNHLEMNNTDEKMIVKKIKKSNYYSMYKEIYGNIPSEEEAFKNIIDAIVCFEESIELNPFTSKFDYFKAGLVEFNEAELRGWNIFNDTLRGKCSNCHTTEPDPIHHKILFTDYTYDNLGIPKNPNQTNTDSSEIDYGLGGFLKDKKYYGLFKVPSLRNVAISAPYFHNGIFQTLEEVVHFYNKRDVEKFPAPEVEMNINRDEIGNLGLTDDEEKDLVTFLKTLTDGYKLK